MASLQQVYGTALGIIPREKPVLNDKFFPLKDEKYIVIHNDNRLQSKYYDYFPEVISLIRPVLNKLGYKIYQIGGKSDPPLEVDERYLGLEWEHSFYIIKNASLFCGQDSVNAHIAAGYGIPSVVLFSHTYPEQVETDWLPADKKVILEPEWGNQKPSYSPVEKPKMIRTIKVESVVQAVFDLLKTGVKLEMKTIRVGEDYHEQVIEVVPDFFANNESLKNGALHFRMDLKFDESNLFTWLKNGYSGNIITNRPISLEGLRAFKQNVRRVTLIAKDVDSYDLNYVRAIKNLGIDLLLICPDNDKISWVREKFFDYPVESLTVPERFLLDKIPKHAKFFTKKQIFARGQIYPSVSHYKQNIPFSRANRIIDSSDFWLDFEYYFFYI